MTSALATRETAANGTSTKPVRFHLSLNVSDIPQAVAFFERVLGVPATKKRDDYAKFELDSPPLVFSLQPRSPGLHGSLNHVGFRFPDAATLVDVQRRLEQAGIPTQREEGVECCYAKQTKFWVNDLDHRLWEFYVLEGDIDHRGEGQALENMVGADAATLVAAQMAPVRQPVVYEHYMGQPFTPSAEPCDEIRLRGTFNVPITNSEVRQILDRARTSLRPGGKVHLHQLTSDVPVPDGSLDLPGRAAVVKHVPVRTDLLQALQDAGFQQIALTKFGANPCFNVNGTGLRETMIEARVDHHQTNAQQFDIVYKGPFASIQMDDRTAFPRGERITITSNTWDALESAGVAQQFARLAPASALPISCGVSVTS